MDTKTIEAKIEVDIERLDSDIIDEHLRSSTAVLQEIMNDNECKTEDGAHMCLHCGKLYKTATSLSMHLLLKHPDDRSVAKCSVCDKEYPSTMSLQKHVRYMHRYSHRCGACYRTFQTITQLSAHMVNCSKKETPCDNCGKVFDSALALRNHVKYKHPGDMNNSCDMCRRTFTSSRSLSNHIATIHPQSFNCGRCHRSFNLKALQPHIKRKHLVCRIKCVLCCKLFKSNKELYMHLCKIHFNGENSHYCGFCNNVQ